MLAATLRQRRGLSPTLKLAGRVHPIAAILHSGVDARFQVVGRSVFGRGCDRARRDTAQHDNGHEDCNGEIVRWIFHGVNQVTGSVISSYDTDRLGARQMHNAQMMNVMIANQNSTKTINMMPMALSPL